MASVFASATTIATSASTSDLATRQEQAYDRYQASVTEGTKQGFQNPRVLSEDFVKFIEEFRQIDPNSIKVSHLGAISFPKKIFYQTLLSQTFHVYWSADSSTGTQGSGNTVIVDFRHDNETNRYYLRYHGLTISPQVFYFDDVPDDRLEYVLSSRSVVFSAGFVSMLFRLIGKNINGAPIWNHQLLVNGRIYANYDLVDFRLSV